jgi:2'-5' RNA ligase
MRLFTAIDIPAEVSGRLGGLVDRLRPAAKISWTTVEKMHITSKFIGEWPEDRLEEMKQALAGVRGRPMEIAVRKLGWYPNAQNPRVLWAGVDGGEALESLAKETDRAVEKIGVPGDGREYSPHLTLARIRKRVPLGALKSAVDGAESSEFGSFRAGEFYLYLSRAGGYQKLAGFEVE